MRRRLYALLWAMLLALLLASISCTIEQEAPDKPQPDVVEDVTVEGPVLELTGGGLRVDGELLGPGADSKAVEAALGAPPAVREMGSFGRMLVYPELGFEIMVTAVEGQVMTIHIFPDFNGTNDWGLAVGSALDDGHALLSDATPDPFGMGYHIESQGLTVGVRDGTVTSLSLWGLQR